LFSSGISLVVQSGAVAAKHNPKDGHIPVLVCHATSSVPNSYVVEYPDADSTGLIGPNGHQAHRDHPNKTWKRSGWWNGTYYNAGDPKRDYIHSYTDANGVFHPEDGDITAAFCTAAQTAFLSVTPSVTFTDCTTGANGWSGTPGTGIAGYAVTSGSTANGDTIVITATAAPHYTFSSDPNVDQPTQTFQHTFPSEGGDCSTPTSTPTIPTHPGTTVGTIAPSFRDASCPSTNAAVDLGGQGFLNAADLAATNNQLGVLGVIYTVTGSLAPGGSVTVTATPADPTVSIAAGQQTVWTHSFPKVNCHVPPPTHPHQVTPPPTHPNTVVPVVVHSGLESVETNSNVPMRDIGLGLVGAGLLLLVGSAGALRSRA
jgi:hypothetical protein